MFGEAIPCLKHFQNNVFGIVLLSMGLLCRAGVYLSNIDCVALRAMTGHEGESAVILFVVFSQLLKPCGAFRNLDYSVFHFPILSKSTILNLPLRCCA